MKEKVVKARVRLKNTEEEEEEKAGGQQEHKGPLCLLEAWGTDRVKLTTVLPGSQKCLFNKQRGKPILHMTHLRALSIFQELLVN